MPFVNEMLLHVVKVWTIASQRFLTNATGFFYQQEGYLYLITARHVVDNPSAGHHPDSLQISLHVDSKDLHHINELSIPLYLDGVSQWFECHYCENVDIVAVAINDPHVLSSHVIHPFRREDVLDKETIIPMGQDALILGFPLGFHDTLNHLPIVRKATIASSFAHPFKGQPYFITDARLHRGMSGSPVIAKVMSDVNSGNSDRNEWRLLGIHTSSLDVSDRDPLQDERLALNSAWYASLIPEMLSEQSAPGTVQVSNRSTPFQSKHNRGS